MNIPFLSVEWNELDRKLAPAGCISCRMIGVGQFVAPKWGHVVEGRNDGRES